MKTLKKIGLAAGICLATTFSVSANAEDEAAVLPKAGDNIQEYRRAGEWMIYENQTSGHCFMTRSDEESGSAVQMGITKSGAYGYVGAFIKGAEVEEGIKDVAVEVNGNIYVGESNTAVNLADGYKGGYILSDNKQLRLDLGKADEMHIFPDAPYSVTVKLKDAHNAIFEVRKCTDELQAG